MKFFSTGDIFLGNAGPDLILIASDRPGSATSGENHDNRIVAHIIDASIDGLAPGILAIGGRYQGTAATEKSGTGNIVSLLVRNTEAPTPIVSALDNSPVRAFVIDPPNRVVLIGSR